MWNIVQLFHNLLILKAMEVLHKVHKLLSFFVIFHNKSPQGRFFSSRDVNSRLKLFRIKNHICLGSKCDPLVCLA